ncbi:MAG TPA: hypothetical protein VHE30_04475 [Polyangiaceae bacterium]|nr:hypothetical protein [Polyangiaceae bacterium]
MNASIARLFAGLFLAFWLPGCSASADAASPSPRARSGSDSGTPSPSCNPDDTAFLCDGGVCPPAAPACGPGSASYPHASVRVTSSGTGVGTYALYEPDEPRPASAPVVAFVHGFALTDNRPAYDAFLRHLARKGFVVVFPEYGFIGDLTGYVPTARRTLADGLAALADGTHVSPDGRFGMVGHSLGGMLALTLAATTTTAPAIPAPAVLVLAEPAGTTFDALTGLDLSAPKLAGIAAGTKLLVIEAETSLTDANSASPDAWANTTTVRAADKNWLVVHSDSHGAPALVSDHLGVQFDPASNAPLDTIDFWGYFRPTEAALDLVFGVASGGAYSPFCRDASAECDPVRDMGRWSDGTPVRRIENAGDRGL